jgi:hypothetical protein
MRAVRDSGLLWRNRPCRFLHFEIWRSLGGVPPFPESARHAILARHAGDLAPAASYGVSCGTGDAAVFFCNHTRFRWRDHGAWYVATLHRFGTQRETRILLARIIGTLRPRSFFVRSTLRVQGDTLTARG